MANHTNIYAAPAPLIKVTNTTVLDGRQTQTVDARELHGFLGVGKDFSTWIKLRIGEYQFVEGKDFVIDSPELGNQTGRGGDRRSVTYLLTLDMAKELSMVERSEMGRRARQYFISCERQLRAQQESRNATRGSYMEDHALCAELGRLTAGQETLMQGLRLLHDELTAMRSAAQSSPHHLRPTGGFPRWRIDAKGRASPPARSAG